MTIHDELMRFIKLNQQEEYVPIHQALGSLNTSETG